MENDTQTLTIADLDALASTIADLENVEDARAWTRVKGKERIYITLWSQNRLGNGQLIVHADGRIDDSGIRWSGAQARDLHQDETIPAIEALVEQAMEHPGADESDAVELPEELEEAITEAEQAIAARDRMLHNARVQVRRGDLDLRAFAAEIVARAERCSWPVTGDRMALAFFSALRGINGSRAPRIRL